MHERRGSNGFAVVRTASRGFERLRRCSAFVVVIALAAPSLASAAIDDYLGKTVGSVRLVVEGRPTLDPALTSVVDTLAGRPLSMANVRQTVVHLFGLGRFEDVRVDATLENGRVALRYELSPIHAVYKIRFEGAQGQAGIHDDDLRRAITDRFGASPPIGRLADMSRLVTDALRERGFIDATVSPRADLEHDPDRAVLVFTLQPGARTTIGGVEVVGRWPAGQAELPARLGLKTGAPYEPNALNTRIERYVDDRRAAGYYEAKIVPAVRIEADHHVANVVLTVSLGPRVRVVFEPRDVLPPDRQKELVPVQREGSVDEDLLEDSTNRIEEFFKAQGYRDATAPHTREATNDDLTVTFTIKRGQAYRVASYEISGDASIPVAEFEAALRVKAGQPFSDGRLDADVATIEDLYHRRGFTAARAQSAVEVVTPTPPPAEVPVAVRIVVNEGARTIVDAVTFTGNQAIDETMLRGLVRLQADAPFVPGQLAGDRDAVQAAYQDLGYENATVDATPVFSADNTRVTVAFAVREGQQILVDHVLIVGNVRTATATIERELQVKPGAPFSLSAINESQRRLAGLSLFRRVRISELRHGDEAKRDLLVTVDEAPATTVGVGGGLEGRLVASTSSGGPATDELDLAPRVFFEIGRRNLFGRNRSVNLFTSLSLHSQHSTAAGVTEYRVVGTFREPRLFDTSADAFVNATIEQQTRSSFDFRRRSVSAAIARHVTPTISVTGNYSIQRTTVFETRIDAADLPLLNQTFTPFLISSFSASVVRDTRNDPIDPASGTYVSTNGQLAGKAIGSEVGFVKSFVTAQAFHALPSIRRLVVAGNVRLGLASGFSELGDLPASERFFAGGDTTVRGFAVDRLGIHHVPFQPVDTLDSEGLPIGGNGLAIFNAELRSTINDKSQVVGFWDAGQVFARAAEIDLTELRSALGGGIRYKSPVGPIRFDLGFKVHRQPGEGLTAWFVSFGQAF